jgi:hypothetical protein
MNRRHRIRQMIDRLGIYTEYDPIHRKSLSDEYNGQHFVCRPTDNDTIQRTPVPGFVFSMVRMLAGR